MKKQILLLLILLSTAIFANSIQDTNLIRASFIGDITKIKSALKNGANIEIQYSKHKQTPLLISIFNGHTDVAKYLLNQGANIDATSSSKKGVLHYAMQLDDFEFFKYLLQKGVSLSYETKGGDLFTYASNYRDVKYAKELLKYKKFNINKKYNFNYDRKEYYWYETTVFLKACEYNNIKMVKFLLKNGADINIPTSKGETALLIALKYDYKKLVEFLVQNGAKLDVEDDAKNSVLSYAIKSDDGYDNIALKAINSGLDVTQWLNENVAKKDERQKQEYDIEYRKSTNQYTYLHLASSYSSPKVIKALINKGLNIDTKSKGQLKYPALGFAAFKKNFEGFKYLVNQGANIYERYEGANTGSSYLYYTLGGGKYYTPLSLAMVGESKYLSDELIDFILKQKDFKKFLNLEDGIFYKNFYRMTKYSSPTSIYNKVINKFDKLGFVQTPKLKDYIKKLDTHFSKPYKQMIKEPKTVMEYIRDDNFIKAKELLKNGADFNQTIYYNNNILHRTFTIRKYAKHTEFIKYIVNNSAILNNINDDKETAMDDFLENSYYNDVELLKFLINSGAKLGSKNIIFFLKKEHSKQYNKILFSYLDNKLKKEDLTQLCISLLKLKKSTNIKDIIKYAIKNNQTIDLTKIYVKAKKYKQNNIVEFCVLFGVDFDSLVVLVYDDINKTNYKKIINQIKNKTNQNDYKTYLEYYITKKDLNQNFDMKFQIIKELSINLQIESLEDSFKYCLTYSDEKQYEKLVEYFIYKGVKLDIKSKYKRYKSITPIVWAIKFNKPKILKYILAQGISADFKPDKYRASPIMHAFYYDKFEMFKILLQNGVNLRGDYKIGVKHNESIANLLNNRINDTQGVRKQRDLLYEIIRRTIKNDFDTKYIQALIDTKKFDINNLNEKYLLSAIELPNKYLTKTLEVMKLLINNGLKLDNIYTRKDKKGQNDVHHTTLIYAAYSRGNYMDFSYHSKKLKLLVDLGASTNDTDQDKDTALHNMVMTLVEVTRRKDMEASDILDAKDGIKILLDAKIDKTLKNNSGKTAYDLAVKYLKDIEIIELLDFKVKDKKKDIKIRYNNHKPR